MSRLTRLLGRLRRAMGLTPPIVDPAEGYRRWAASYGHEPNALQKLEANAMARCLPVVKGRDVLDLGCGKGRVAELMLTRGARRAVAADSSLAMLVDPQACRAAQLCRLAAGVAPLPFPDASFDVVVCALVLGHVAELAEPLAEMARVLRPGGDLLLSDFHPFATLRGFERTFTDEASGRTYAIAQHLHLLSDYVSGLSRHGLAVNRLVEPSFDGWPVVFVLRAHKAPSNLRVAPAR